MNATIRKPRMFGPRAKTEPLREAIKLCDAAVKWADGGGKVSAEELRAIRAALAKATATDSKLEIT